MKKLILAVIALIGLNTAATAQTRQVPNATPAQAGKVVPATAKPVSNTKMTPKVVTRDQVGQDAKHGAASAGTQAAGPTNATAKPANAPVRPNMSSKVGNPTNVKGAKNAPTNATPAPAKGAPKK